MGMKKNNAQVKILEKKMSESIGDKCAPASSLVLSKSRSRVIRFSCRYLSLCPFLPLSLSLSLSPLLPFKHVSHVARALYRRPCVYVYIYIYIHVTVRTALLYTFIYPRVRARSRVQHTLCVSILSREDRPRSSGRAGRLSARALDLSSLAGARSPAIRCARAQAPSVLYSSSCIHLYMYVCIYNGAGKTVVWVGVCVCVQQ